MITQSATNDKLAERLDRIHRICPADAVQGPSVPSS